MYVNLLTPADHRIQTISRPSRSFASEDHKEEIECIRIFAFFFPSLWWLVIAYGLYIYSRRARYGVKFELGERLSLQDGSRWPTTLFNGKLLFLLLRRETVASFFTISLLASSHSSYVTKPRTGPHTSRAITCAADLISSA